MLDQIGNAFSDIGGAISGAGQVAQGLTPGQGLGNLISGNDTALIGPAESIQGINRLTAGAASAGGKTVAALETIPGVGNAVRAYIGLQLADLHVAGEALHALGPGVGHTVGLAAGKGAGVLGAATGQPGLQAQVTRNVTNAVNSGFDFLQHQYRMLSEVQREHGDAAMVQAALPFLITAGVVAGSSAFGQEEIAGPEAAVLGGEYTAEAAAAANAAEATANMGRSVVDYWRQWADLMAAAKGDPGALSRILPNAGRAMETIVKYNPASLALRGASVVGKVATSPAYLAGSAAQYTADKTIFQHEWKVTANGAEWAATSGRPDTFGSFIASVLPKSEATSLFASAVNFGTYFLLPDPIGAAGHVHSAAYSAAGLPGWLHKYMPGASLDMARAAYESPLPFMRKVKNSIDFIATHDAGQIISFNKDLTPIAGELDKLKVLKEDGSLDHSATVDRVLEYFAAVETVKKLTTTSTLPLRGIGSLIHDLVTDKALLRQFEKLPFHITWEKGEVAGHTVFNAKIEAHKFSPEDPMAPYLAAWMARQAFHLSSTETDALANDSSMQTPAASDRC